MAPVYPGLSSHPDHEIARQQMSGFEGMVGFLVKNKDTELASRVVDNLKLFHIAVSLGGVESLVCQPAFCIFKDMTPDERSRAGIEESLVRLSIGLEKTEDLIGDLYQALDRAPGK